MFLFAHFEAQGECAVGGKVKGEMGRRGLLEKPAG
jgi:hypothetical protein